MRSFIRIQLLTLTGFNVETELTIFIKITADHV